MAQKIGAKLLVSFKYWLFLNNFFSFKISTQNKEQLSYLHDKYTVTHNCTKRTLRGVIIDIMLQVGDPGHTRKPGGALKRGLYLKIYDLKVFYKLVSLMFKHFIRFL